MSANIGNDFAAFYPSARGGIELVHGGVRLGSAVQVIRIAAGFGSGTYWVQWIPLRAGYAFSW